MQAGVQHAQSPHTQEEPQLSPSGLQFQSETSVDFDNQEEEKVQVWKRFQSVPRDSSSNQAYC